MIRAMWKGLQSFLLSLFVLIAFATPSYAAVDIGNLQGLLNGSITPKQVNQTDKPFLADRNQAEEIIDPVTGSMTLKHTDLTLPGRDGLDLSIARLYNSSQAEMGTKNVTVTSSSDSWSESSYSWMVSIPVYTVSSGQWWTKTMGPYSSASTAISSAESFIASTSSDLNNIYFDYTVSYVSTTTYYTSYTITTTNKTERYNYLRSRYDLGAGWSFAFPSVQIENRNGSQYLFFHDGTGASYPIKFTSDTTDSNLVNYQGKDAVFQQDSSSYSNGQVNSAYVFISSDKRKTYFGSDGRLLGVKDRFGNEIKFTHINRAIYGVNYPYISQITDSIGRTVDFVYQNTITSPDFNGEDITVTVNDPGKTKNLSFKYTKYKWMYGDGSGNTAHEPVLAKFTDAEGGLVSYRYDDPQDFIKYRYDTKSLATPATAHVALLSDVNYPYTRTYYRYQEITRNLGPDGAYAGYRVSSRYDHEWRWNPDTNTWYETGDLHHANYTYTNDYTGYPSYAVEESIPESYRYSSQSHDLSTGLISKTTFNGKGQQLTVETTASNGEKKVSTNSSFDSRFTFKPTRTVLTEYAANGTLVNTYYVDQTYADWGGVLTSTLPLTAAQINDAATKALYTTTFEYEPTYRMLTKKSWYQDAGKPVSQTYAYDALGRAASSTNELGETTSYAYSTTAEGRVEEITKPLENGKTAKTVKVYGAQSKNAYPTIVRQTYTDANNQTVTTSSTKVYDLLLGLIVSDTDEAGQTTQYAFDRLGRVVSIKLPNLSNINNATYSVEQKIEYQPYYTNNRFDDVNRHLMTTSVLSYTLYTNVSTGTQYHYNYGYKYYDGYGKLRFDLFWDYERGEYLNVAQTHFDNAGRMTYHVDAEGNANTYAYGVWGELAESVDAQGNLARQEYDLTTNKSTSFLVTQANVATYRANPASDSVKESVTEVYYDQFNRAKERRMFPNWPTKTGYVAEAYTYDIAGNILTYTNPRGYTTTNQYDALNRLVKVTDALQQVSEYGYNKLGFIQSVKLSEKDGSDSWTTSYEYDELGRNTKETQPNGQFETYVPNAVGQVLQRTDLNQVQFSQTYDQHNQLTSKTGGNLSVKYHYDTPFGPRGMEQYTGTVNTASLWFGFSPTGSVKKFQKWQDGYYNEVNQLYDKTDRITSIQDPAGYATQYEYLKDRLNKVRLNGTSSAVSYEYYPDGKPKSVVYPTLSNGTTLRTNYVYDKLNRLDTVTNVAGTQTLSAYKYTYDNNSNITSVLDQVTNQTTGFLYDELDRLIEVRRPDGTTAAYTYDVRGNRKTLSDDRLPLDFKDLSYTYNVWNELTSATHQAGTTSYTYDPSGLRTKKATPTETVRYHYNSDEQVIAESNAGNQLTAHYIWGTDRVLAKEETTGKKYYYLYNGHGDVVQMVDTNGVVVNRYEYDEWGGIVSQTEQVKNPFKYSGEVYDEDTGLYYLRARYYDPSIGRFINKDTYEGDISNPLSLNLYSYVYNNPLKYVDPTGHIAWYQYYHLAKGIGSSVVGSLAGLFDPKTYTAIYEVGKAVATGSISFKELANAVGASAAEPFKYLFKHSKHIWQGNPTNAEVQEYGKHLGNVLQMFIGGSGLGAKAILAIEKASSKLGKALRALDKICNCFTAGTTVLTEDGEKPIEEIEIGDKVLAKDDETGEMAYKEVEWLFQREVEETYNLTVGGRVITTTDEHPFWIVDEGWVKAKDLVAGDLLTTSDGKELAIEKIEIKREHVVVYNFQVKDFHSYFVSNLGVWTHNSCFDAGAFEKKISNMNVNEKVALVRTTAADLAKMNGWTKDSKLSRMNGRDVYFDTSSGKYYAVDTQHGRFEVVNKKGKHQGEVNFNLDPTKPADKSGGHDLKMK